MALGPNLFIAGISILKHSNTKAAGSKYRLATKYSFESEPDIIPRELKMAGKK
jgi:hypothetical protein